MNAFKQFLYYHVIPFIGRICVGRNKYINVIYYHDVLPSGGRSYMKIEYDLFLAQMQYLRQEGYQTYTFQELNEQGVMPFGEKQVLITFDDGWLSNYTTVFPLLKDMGIKFNVFLAAGLIGVNPGYMNWEMVEEMARSGMCGFGAHTYDHVNMDDLSGMDFHRQITMTDDLIEKHCGYRPLDFCFPKGKYTPASLEYFVRESPYTRIYPSDLDYSRMENGKIIFGRNAISNDEDMSVFRKKLKGYFNIFQTLGGRVR